MQVTGISVANFRNFTHQEFIFGEHLNFVVGPNARGKTNVLEAISVLLARTPLRSAAMRDLVSWGADGFALSGTVQHRSGKSALRLLVGPVGPYVQGAVEGARLAPARARAPVVFTPDDLRVVREEPDKRRAFLDAVGSRLRPGYLKRRQEYERVLRQRNAVLKEGPERSSPPEVLAAWDEQLVILGSRLTIDRREVVEELGAPAADSYASAGVATGRRPSLALAYESAVLTAATSARDVATAFRALLEARRHDEFRRRITLVGPHRDDLSIRAEGVDLRAFGSRGEQRLAAIALKVAERSLVATMLGEQPVLLLDDVMSELDRQKRNLLLKTLGDGQVFITATSLDGFDTALTEGAQVMALD